MSKIITWYNLICIFLSLIFSAISYYRSKAIFIKARYRDVREILSDNILRYERVIRRKFIAKFLSALSMWFLMINRVFMGFIYISTLDMATWVLIATLTLYVGWVDYSTSLPEKQK